MFSVRNGSTPGGASVTTISVTADTHASVVSQDYLNTKETHNWHGNIKSVSVINVDGADDLYANVNATVNPTVGGNNCVVIPGVAGASVSIPTEGPGPVVVRLVSTAAVAYSVEFR